MHLFANPVTYLDISLGMGIYEKYTLASPFDLRCQSGIYVYISLDIRMLNNYSRQDI